MSDTLYWIWLSLALGPKSAFLTDLAEKFGNAYEIYAAQEDEYREFGRLPRRVLEGLCCKDLEGARRISDYCSVNGIGIFTYAQERYPMRLRNIQEPPAVFYCRGNFPDIEAGVSVSVVGTRRMSGYGERASHDFAYDIAAAGAIVVSGMALGCDGMAAAGALEAGGITIAVLGTAIDVIYPAEHKRLYHAICKNGAVISEYPPGSVTEKRSFPERNRLISALTNCTLVTEADSKSGALITARCALMQGKRLFALPGMVGEKNSEGTNMLLHDGAEIALSAADVLGEYLETYPDKLDFAKLAHSGHGNIAEAAEKYSVSKRSGAGKQDTDGSAETAKPRKAVTGKSSPGPTAQTAQTAQTAREVQTVDTGLFESLDENTKRIYGLLPKGRIFLPDDAAGDIPIGELMSALTMLEICGAATALPGGRFVVR